MGQGGLGIPRVTERTAVPERGKFPGIGAEKAVVTSSVATGFLLRVAINWEALCSPASRSLSGGPSRSPAGTPPPLGGTALVPAARVHQVWGFETQSSASPKHLVTVWVNTEFVGKPGRPE